MATKAAQLKQTFSFKSLRLMEKKDCFGSSLKSFSDSEVNEHDDKKTFKTKVRSKSQSENSLNVGTSANFSSFNYKTSYTSEIDQNTIGDYNEKLSHRNLKEKQSSKINTNIEVNNNNSNVTSENIAKITNTELCDKVKSSNYYNNSETFLINQEQITDTISIEVSEQAGVGKEKANMETSDFSANLASSGPYKIFEGPAISGNSNVLGEPRCLTMKKYIGDVNPFLTDDSLSFEPDFEDDIIANNSVNPIEKRNFNSIGPIKDMFQDEDDDNSSKKKRLAVDREEGELSPDVHQQSSNVGKANKLNINPTMNAEFFKTINECLRELDNKCKEFYSTSTPEICIKHLQTTISNVDSIKRKLTFLMNTKNPEAEKRKKLQQALLKLSKSKSNHKIIHEQSMSHTHLKSGGDVLSSNRHKSSVSGKLEDNGKEFHSKTNKNSTSSYFDEGIDRRRNESGNSSRHSHKRRRSSRDKPSQTDLLQRKKLSILEKIGTKKEIERIQSLFQRQMSLITQHVIQKKKINRSHSSQKEESDKIKNAHKEKEEEERKKKLNLENINTLEDMESFLNMLKSKTSNKIACEQYINDAKRKKSLKFTSKKEKSDDLNVLGKKKKIFTSVTNETRVENVFKKPFSSDDPQVVSVTKKQNEILEVTKSQPQITDLPVKDIKSNSTSKNDKIQESHQKRLLKCNSEVPDNHPCIDKLDQLNVDKLTENKIAEENKTNDEIVQGVFSKDNKYRFSLEKNYSDSVEKVENSQHHKLSDGENVSQMKKQELNKRKRDQNLDNKSNESESEKGEPLLKRQKTMKCDILPEQIPSEKLKTIETNEPDTEYFSNNEKPKIMSEESLVNDLLSKKILILDDNNLAVNSQFCIKVIGNEVYLKKLSKRKKRRQNRKCSSHHQVKKIEKYPQCKMNPKTHSGESECKETNAENVATLEEMERFFQELRSKRKASCYEQEDLDVGHSQAKEEKFLARIQAKRKAKLMACVSGNSNPTEKEAKFLKALEKKDKEISDSSDIESRKLKLIEKIRAETDAIVLAEKSNAEDDPLIEVKNLLNMIKDENSKQDSVSFSLKRSDVKRLESLTAGKMSAMTEESQKFLNSVRAKIRAKKVPVSNISALMQRPEL